MNSNVTFIKTRKYKDVNLYLRFSWRTTPELRARAFLLSKMMGEATTIHKTKESMQRVKDMLYGISIDTACKTRCDVSSYDIHYSFINPRFVNEPIENYCSFIEETLNNTLISSKTLKEAKRSIISTLKRENDKPSFYAKQKVTEIASEEYPTMENQRLTGRILKDVENTSLKDVRDFYRFLFNECRLHVYLTGDVDNDTVEILTSYPFGNDNEVKIRLPEKVYKNKGEIVEKKKQPQSIYAKLFQSPFDKKSEDFYAFKLGNYFLGMAPCSLLFEEVREKRSLCYSIAAIDYSYYGMVKVVTSIDADKKDIVSEQIDEQIRRLVDKDYDLRKLEMAKALFLNMLDSLSDDGDGYIDFLYENLISDFDPDIEAYKKKIIAVTADDISRIFKEYRPYFSYMMEGVLNG
ncbi:MAG: insulinase family protein [Erysipelotrichaceae bacterium]|nr:insulinase family protein [Erysipelotrichaceae bacterium]